MDSTEEAIVFGPPDATMIGVLHYPTAMEVVQALVIVPGGPQNRVGNGRQFVELARTLAASGIVVLRYDCPGMGDSKGPLPHFERNALSVGFAVTEVERRFSRLVRIAVWGLCDGATAAMFAAARDARIWGVVAANPWARTAAGRADALIRTYYGERLRSAGFWRRVLSGHVAIWPGVRSFIRNLVLSTATAQRRDRRTRETVDALDRHLTDTRQTLPRRIAAACGLRDFRLLLIISPEDLTGAEFVAQLDPYGLFDRPRTQLLRIDGSDHAFSAREDWDRVKVATAVWLTSAVEPSA